MEILISVLASAATTLFLFASIQGAIILYELRKNKKEKEAEKRIDAELNQLLMQMFSVPKSFTEQNQVNWNDQTLNFNNQNEKDNGTDW